jgi:acyl carrier protein
MGGHSLKATMLATHINRQFHVDIPIKEIFNKQTIESIADYLITVSQIKSNTKDDANIIEIAL